MPITDKKRHSNIEKTSHKNKGTKYINNVYKIQMSQVSWLTAIL